MNKEELEAIKELKYVLKSLAKQIDDVLEVIDEYTNPIKVDHNGNL